MGRTFSSNDIVKMTDLSYRQVDHWTRLEVLLPICGPNPGSGAPRRYPERELLIAATLAALTELGASLSICRELASTMRTLDPAEFHGMVFVTQDGRLTRDPWTAGSCWCIDLDEILQPA